LVAEDHHVSPGVLEPRVIRREKRVLWDENRQAGALRYGPFQDHIPFMNFGAKSLRLGVGGDNDRVGGQMTWRGEAPERRKNR
jgi:hypothetical protein